MNQAPLNNGPLMHFYGSIGHITHYPGFWLHLQGITNRNRPHNGTVHHQVSDSNSPLNPSLIAEH